MKYPYDNLTCNINAGISTVITYQLLCRQQFIDGSYVKHFQKRTFFRVHTMYVQLVIFLGRRQTNVKK